MPCLRAFVTIANARSQITCRSSRLLHNNSPPQRQLDCGAGSNAQKRFKNSYADTMHVPHSAALAMRGKLPRQKPRTPSLRYKRVTTSHVENPEVTLLRPATCSCVLMTSNGVVNAPLLKPARQPLKACTAAMAVLLSSAMFAPWW